jgi:hypothetical protein
VGFVPSVSVQKILDTWHISLPLPEKEEEDIDVCQDDFFNF